MPYHGWSKIRTELLMDISASLADYTRTPEDFRLIPAYLARTFDLHPVSLAIVHTARHGATVFLGAFSGNALPDSFHQDLLTIHQQTRPLSTQDGPTLRPVTEIGQPPDAADVSADTAGSLGASGRATVFTHSIDEDHRMLLIVHQRTDDPHLSAGMTDILQLVAQQLGKLLESLVIWMARPELFGTPFNDLTDREWMVLRNLNSDAGEKQLADQLGLSPHTLHSHIKAIYRKVGVQGRLPLLLRAQEAMRDLRLSRVSSRPFPMVPESDRVVAVG
jgi:DNA-binding CsgD family transcriptional regulator